MAIRKWAGYTALHPVTVCTGHQRLQSWHEEHVDTPSQQASRRARWHEILAKFDLMVVYVPGMDNTVADCLSRWAYPTSKGMTDVSSHGGEAETAQAEKIIDMERMMEEKDVKCFVVMAAEAPPGRRVSRAVPVLAPEGASKMTGQTTTPRLRLLSPSTGLSLTLTTGRSDRRGSSRKMASSTGTVGW